MEKFLPFDNVSSIASKNKRSLEYFFSRLSDSRIPKVARRRRHRRRPDSRTPAAHPCSCSRRPSCHCWPATATSGSALPPPTSRGTKVSAISAGRGRWGRPIPRCRGRRCFPRREDRSGSNRASCLIARRASRRCHPRWAARPFSPEACPPQEPSRCAARSSFDFDCHRACLWLV